MPLMRSAEGCHCVIANGDLEWQSYFINWNNNYFDPALEKANSIAATESMNNVKLRQTSSPSPTTKRISSTSRREAGQFPRPALDMLFDKHASPDFKLAQVLFYKIKTKGKKQIFSYYHR